MAFRFAPAPFVIVGTPDVNSIIIQPQGPITSGPEIDFTHADAFGVKDASGWIGFSGLTFAMSGPDLVADPGNPPALFLSNTGAGANAEAQLIGDAIRGILYNVGGGANPNRNGIFPIITNTNGYGAATNGEKWLYCISYHSGIAAPGGFFNITIPFTFPTGEIGCFGWPSLQAAVGVTLLFNNAFPAGVRNQMTLWTNVAANISFALLTIGFYV